MIRLDFPGYSGAELANVINEAALRAARRGMSAGADQVRDWVCCHNNDSDMTAWNVATMRALI